MRYGVLGFCESGVAGKKGNRNGVGAFNPLRMLDTQTPAKRRFWLTFGRWTIAVVEVVFGGIALYGLGTGLWVEPSRGLLALIWVFYGIAVAGGVLLAANRKLGIGLSMIVQTMIVQTMIVQTMIVQTIQLVWNATSVSSPPSAADGIGFVPGNVVTWMQTRPSGHGHDKDSSGHGNKLPCYSDKTRLHGFGQPRCADLLNHAGGFRSARPAF